MKKTLTIKGTLWIIILLLSAENASANPKGANVISGQASLAHPSVNALTITNTPGAIINWQSFDINPNEITRFIQQNGASAVLNRVVGNGLTASQIMGTLASNGKVFLINPNGIVFGANSVVDTAGLIASSLNISDQDFLNNNLQFDGNASNGAIENKGYIKAGLNGEVFLIAPNIENSGIIETNGGHIILAAGEKVSLASFENENIVFQVQSPDNKVTNLGSLITNGGAASIFAGTISHSGSINANSISFNDAGKVTLAAISDITIESNSVITASGNNGGDIHIESEQGTTWVSGTVQATASSNTGGKIEILGENVGLIDNALIDASGESGGGEVLIGGDYLGGNVDVRNAKGTYIGEEVEITANAITNGDGGKVIAWSDESTRVYGKVSATGGSESGNGGFIETSGSYLDLGNYVPDASAPNGVGGEWLIDPYNLTIQAAGPDANAGTSPNFVAGDTGAILTTGSIETALNLGTSVTIATNGGGAEAGTITINDDITKASGGDATLTFNADFQIIRTTALNTDETLNITSTFNNLNLAFNAPTIFTGSGTGTLTLNLDANGGVITFPTLTMNSTNATISGATTTGTLTTTSGDGTHVVTFIDNLAATDIFINGVSTLDLNGAASTTNNLTASGRLGGTGKLTVSTLMSTSSGASGFPYLLDSITLETPVGATTNIVTDFSLYDTSVWNNSGTINWTKSSGNPRFYIYQTAVFNNLADGVFNDSTSSASLTGFSGHNTAQFNNIGTYNKTGSAQVIFQGPTFVNTGTVNVSAGEFEIYPSGTPPASDTGDYIATGTGTLEFRGPRTFSATTSISSATSVTFIPGGVTYQFPNGSSLSTPELTIGSGNVIFDSGSTLNLSNSLTTNGGNIFVNTANFTLPSSITIGIGSLILNSGIANPTVSNLTITGSSLQGTDDLTVTNLFNWSGGQIYTDINNTGTANITGNVRIDEIFTNAGTMNIGADYESDDGSLINNATVNWTAGTFIESGGLASITNNGTFNISGNNVNEIDFTNNGTLSKTAGGGTSSFEGSFTNTGTVNASSGSLEFDGYTQTAGLTQLNGGDIDDTGAISVFNGGTLAGVGTFTTPDLFINNGATIAPGASPGTLNITGNLILAATSTTLIELGGTTQGSNYDFINVTGNVNLDGILDISLFGGFTGVTGNIFDVIQSGGTMNGSFATVNLPTGYSFNTGIFGGNVYRLGLLVVPVTPSPSPSSSPTSTSTESEEEESEKLQEKTTNEILVLEENFDAWDLGNRIFGDRTTEEYDDQALICS
jgi:filamentous hemagglutinin family protein